jgi:hypothetical protein
MPIQFVNISNFRLFHIQEKQEPGNHADKKEALRVVWLLK